MESKGIKDRSESNACLYQEKESYIILVIVT